MILLITHVWNFVKSCSSHLNSFLAYRYNIPPSPDTNIKTHCIYKEILTENSDIEQHQEYENNNDSSEVVLPSLKTHTEHINELVKVNNGHVASEVKDMKIMMYRIDLT